MMLSVFVIKHLISPEFFCFFQIGVAFQRLVVGGESGQVEPIFDYIQISFSPGADGRINLENMYINVFFVQRRCPP